MKTLASKLLILFLTVYISGTGYSSPRFPLKIIANNRYLSDQNNVPFYWLGDTQWDIFRDFTLDDAAVLLMDRSEKGFSVIQTMILGVGGGTRPNIMGEKPFINDDPEKPNEAFFNIIDSVIKIADKKGVAIALGIYHKSDDYARLITMKNARNWARWLAKRYKNYPNIIWSMFPAANDSYIPIVRELAAGLKEADEGTHLITVHPDPSPASSSWIHNEEWLSFNTIQTWKSDFLNYTMVANDFQRVPVKPVVNGEARYEEEGGTTPVQIRNGAYWSCLAGGFYTYGHGGNWMAPAKWKSWIDSPGSENMKVLGDVFRSLEWWKLVPDQSVFSGNAGQNVAACSPDESLILAYIPKSDKIDIDLAKIKSAGKITATWIDPTTGARSGAGIFNNSGVQTFNVPPGWNDALLYLKGQVHQQ